MACARLGCIELRIFAVVLYIEPLVVGFWRVLFFSLVNRSMYSMFHLLVLRCAPPCKFSSNDSELTPNLCLTQQFKTGYKERVGSMLVVSSVQMIDVV